MNLDASIQALLREVGPFIQTEFERFDYDAVEYKAENDPFTFVDVETERRLRAGCEELIPGSGFITEELENRGTDQAYVWIIDPIDGTSNFTHGLPHFCISLALQHRGETVLGYVYQPITRELFHAAKGEGAYLDGQPIRCSERRDLEMALVCTGFPYAVEGWVQDYLAMIYDIMQTTHGLRRLGSAALDLCYVAAGRIDVYFEYNLKPWDVAAGALIAQEAGGRVSDFWGEKGYLHNGQMLATNGHVHQEILTIMGKSKMVTGINR